MDQEAALLLPPIPPPVAATVAAVEPTKLKLLEARFGADQEHSNSQTSFDSPSLTYHSAPASSQNNGAAVAIPSWQRMQNHQLPAHTKSSLKNVRKQAHPQRKSVVLVVQESPPTKGGKGTTNSNGSSAAKAVRILCESEESGIS
jgi:hypothetical protein